jgi:hypothetical protein
MHATSVIHLALDKILKMCLNVPHMPDMPQGGRLLVEVARIPGTRFPGVVDAMRHAFSNANRLRESC